MTKKKRTVLDDINDRIDDILKNIERRLRGRKRKRALVPIPVRNDDPYRQPPRRHQQ